MLSVYSLRFSMIIFRTLMPQYGSQKCASQSWHLRHAVSSFHISTHFTWFLMDLSTVYVLPLSGWDWRWRWESRWVGYMIKTAPTSMWIFTKSRHWQSRYIKLVKYHKNIIQSVWKLDCFSNILKPWSATGSCHLSIAVFYLLAWFPTHDFHVNIRHLNAHF